MRHWSPSRPASSGAGEYADADPMVGLHAGEGAAVSGSIVLVAVAFVSLGWLWGFAAARNEDGSAPRRSWRSRRLPWIFLGLAFTVAVLRVPSILAGDRSASTVLVQLALRVLIVVAAAAAFQVHLRR